MYDTISETLPEIFFLTLHILNEKNGKPERNKV